MDAGSCPSEKQVRAATKRVGGRTEWPACICSIASSAANIRALLPTPRCAFSRRFLTQIASLRQSTYNAISLGAAHNPDAPAIQYLSNADPADKPIVISHRDFFARVTQAGNMFHALGVASDDVVSLLLPLLPEAFITLFGAEAAGIANPVNPLLEPHQIAEILEAARTSVLVALGPMPGTDIWQKVEQVRGRLKHLKAIVQVHGPGDPANGVYSFSELIRAQPSDKLVSGRKISGDQIAAYFHTGGTTGTPKLVRHTHANEVYQAWAINLVLKSRPGGNLLFGMPLFHVGGSLTQALSTLSSGSCLVVLSAAGWRNPASIKKYLGPRRTLQTGNAIERPDRAGGSVCHPARQCRHIEPAIRSWRRIGDSGRNWQGDRGQVWAQGSRGLRHDRDFERPHDGLSGSSHPPRLGRSACALRPRSCRQAQPTAGSSATVR